MRFRPCIDIHNGKVKQIVGGSLKDLHNQADENFVSEQNADFYAGLYRDKGLKGGHIILLNSQDSEYYKDSVEQAKLALRTYPYGLQIGGGITDENALLYLNEGASHVIVTSYVFKDGVINYENLKRLKSLVGKDKLVLDMSCRARDGKYYVVTDRWQKFTDVLVTEELFYELSEYCDEFLVHAVDVEGFAKGIEEAVARILGSLEGIKVTYAGGIGSCEDLQKLKELTGGKVDFTVGSALDIFGGKLEFNKICDME